MGRPALSKRDKRWWKLRTFMLADSIHFHVERLNKHPELRPANLERLFPELKGHPIQSHWLATLLIFDEPTSGKGWHDVRARWNNYRVGGRFPYDRDQAVPVTPPADPFDLSAYPDDPGTYPADPIEREAFERFLDNEADGKGDIRFAKYLRHRMSYQLMRQVAERAVSLFGWDPGPFWYLVDPIYAYYDVEATAEDWPRLQAENEKRLEREIEERFRGLIERHGWDGAAVVNLASDIAAQVNMSSAEAADAPDAVENDC